MRDNIIISDLHGCRTEFNQLLKKIKYDPKQHRLILVGDFLDRGTDPVGLLHQIQDMNIETTVGNHEEKCERWRRNELLAKITGKPNPMAPVSDIRRKQWEALSKEDVKWLISLPFYIHIKENWYVLHAGAEPSVPFFEQDLGSLIRIRYVDKNTLRHVKPKSKEQPPNTYFWAEKWGQPINLVFGHHRFEEPKIFKNENNVCVGIDTGCVFGGHLTAFNVDRNEFVQVKANSTYYQR